MTTSSYGTKVLSATRFAVQIVAQERSGGGRTLAEDLLVDLQNQVDCNESLCAPWLIGMARMSAVL